MYVGKQNQLQNPHCSLPLQDHSDVGVNQRGGPAAQSANTVMSQAAPPSHPDPNHPQQHPPLQHQAMG
ncbi:hypothetical protein COP1_025386 [Malus domestica]